MMVVKGGEEERAHWRMGERRVEREWEMERKEERGGSEMVVVEGKGRMRGWMEEEVERRGERRGRVFGETTMVMVIMEMEMRLGLVERW